MHPEVTCTIPGARTEAQARDNASAAALPPLGAPTMAVVRGIYDTYVREHVHAAW
jgi:aryl-alcohol dehydrogenase-like predicted oxidoreductase